MYAKENYKYTIEYQEDSFYNKLTEEEQKRYLKHILALQYKTFIHQTNWYLNRNINNNPEIRPGRPKIKKKYEKGKPAQNV